MIVALYFTEVSDENLKLSDAEHQQTTYSAEFRKKGAALRQLLCKVTFINQDRR